MRSQPSCDTRGKAGRREPAKARPFLKWVGGKGQLLRQFRTLLPAAFGRYFEPFVGGGALFFAHAPRRAVLADVNAELVDCYRAIQGSVDDVIKALLKHKYDKDHYYEVRLRGPESLPLARRAARTIFLNRSGYNGLYRVNSAGRFNVPFGRHSNPTLCDASNLRACSKALRGVDLKCCDFADAVRGARRGDFVYFDPPYVPVSPTANFTQYAAGRFGWREQVELASVFADLAKRGVAVMLSNSDTPEVRGLYAAFRIDRVVASRSVNSNPQRRGKVPEVVVRSYETVGSVEVEPAQILRAPVPGGCSYQPGSS
jgi:DNA adenine methylase